MFNTDKPITKLSEDTLGRGKFACQLANAILQFDAKDSYVIALQGKWGCGKTSILNMAIEEIENLSSLDKAEKETIIIQFNPWNFTNTTQLISQFFVMLSNKMKFVSKEQKKANIGIAIEKYSSALMYSGYIPGVGKYFKIPFKISAKSGKLMKENAEKKINDVTHRKEELKKALREINTKVLVIIDDIDRLPNEQIRLIYQLVSAVADLPNITYLLSFDREIVCRALSEIQCCEGALYLEKIIQVPFEVPPLDKEKINNILVEKMRELGGFNNTQCFDNEHWNEVFNSCISPFIKTLRDINRFYNTLNFKYRAVKDEVDFIDMAGVTALCVFAPPIYEWISANKFSLVGGCRGNFIDMKESV